MIPKIFHNIWLGQKKIPKEFLVYHDNWKKLHPDWEYRLWTDDDLKNLDSYIVDFINRAITFASKSDVLRIYAIYKYGGVYADTDFDWNKSLDPLLNNLAFIPKPTSDLYNNAIFGAVPKHPICKLMLDNLEKYVDNPPPPWGPQLITDCLHEVLDQKNITILPRKSFYPYLWTEKRKPASFFPNSYAVHFWDKSWRRE